MAPGIGGGVGLIAGGTSPSTGRAKEGTTNRKIRVVKISNCIR
jgi:hypothetical protein